jgi:hypothetical protein
MNDGRTLKRIFILVLVIFVMCFIMYNLNRNFRNREQEKNLVRNLDSFKTPLIDQSVISPGDTTSNLIINNYNNTNTKNFNSKNCPHNIGNKKDPSCNFSFNLNKPTEIVPPTYGNQKNKGNTIWCSLF